MFQYKFFYINLYQMINLKRNRWYKGKINIFLCIIDFYQTRNPRQESDRWKRYNYIVLRWNLNQLCVNLVDFGLELTWILTFVKTLFWVLLFLCFFIHLTMFKMRIMVIYYLVTGIKKITKSSFLNWFMW